MIRQDFKILLDMDGVLVNFVAGITAALGMDYPFSDPKNLGKWDLDEIWGITPEEFWAPCDNSRFWENLDWMPDGIDILAAAEEAVGEKSVYLLTSPSLSPQSYLGKAAWVKENLPYYLPRLICGSAKHLLAKSCQILVDDADHNVTAFRSAGGPAILVPQHWNSLHGRIGDPDFGIRQQLFEYTI